MRNIRKVALPALLLWHGTAFGQTPETESLKVDLGIYFILNTSTALSYVSSKAVGVTIDSERDLDWQTSLNVFRLDGKYRFTPSHSVDFSYYGFDRDGEVVLDQELTWGDQVYPINANLDTRMSRETYRGSYNWSFHHDEKVELGLSLGLHVTQFSVDLEGTYNGAVVASNSNKLTAPLPVLGFVLNYAITPALTWSNQFELFYLSMSDSTGSLTDLKSALEYSFDKRWGAGLAVVSNRLKAEHTDSQDRTLYLDDHALGLNAYVTLRF
ncbi:MAG: hypothetical protein ABW076_10130 [Candidatus Thiodiazotropha sp.]